MGSSLIGKVCGNIFLEFSVTLKKNSERFCTESNEFLIICMSC